METIKNHHCKAKDHEHEEALSRETFIQGNGSHKPRDVEQLKTKDVITETLKKVELKRTITFFGTVAILIANIGGTGIFIAPTTILSFSGSPGMAMVMWLAGGVMQVSMALCVVEVALMFNKAGGPYYFIYQTFGELPGFVFMWGYLIFIAAPSWALGAYTASLYSLSLVFKDCDPPEELVKLIAVWVMISVIAINCTHMKVITIIQKFLTSCKIIALVIIIILGLINIPTDLGQENLFHFMDGTRSEVGQIALALFAAFYGFGGWPVITILTEEMKHPEKNLPRGLLLSFSILITTMVATNFAYYTVLSKEEALRSDAVAMLFGQMFHPLMPVVIAVLVCLCSVGTLNVLIMSQPRMLFAAGRNGHMPKFMTMLHKKFHTPWPATFTLGLLGIIMVLSGSVLSLVAAISLYAGCMIFLLLLCLFTLRWKSPNAPRPFKVPLVLPVCACVLTVSLVFLSVLEKPKELGFVAMVVALGVPVYFVCIKWQKPAKLFNSVDSIGKYLQLLLDLHYEKN